MKEPDNKIQFSREDFTFSDQVTGEASQTKILFIDWARLFAKKYGETASSGFNFKVPVLGGLMGKKVYVYALYNIMQDNPGYDIVLYPQYETQTTDYILVKHTTVKVTARLGKLKK
jgi:hypothetical protein